MCQPEHCQLAVATSKEMAFQFIERDYRLLQSSNTNSSSNSSTAYRLCPEWFPVHLAYPANNMNNTLGLECPDTIIVPISSGIISLLYVCLVIFSLFCLVWKRKSPSIRARSFSGLLMNIFSNSIIFGFNSTRSILGKNDFPCFLFSMSIFLTGPLFSIPSILRGVRLIVLYRTNLLKTRAFSYSSSSSIVTKVAEFKKEDVNTTVSSWSEQVNKREATFLKFIFVANRILQSNSFTLSSTFVMLIFHILIWMTVGLIDDGYYSNNRLVMTNSSMFSSMGCYSSGPSGIVITSFAAIYWVVDIIVLLVLFFTTEKDTHHIKVELCILASSRAVLLILYFVATQVQVLRILARIIPNHHIFLSYAFIEIIASILWPLFRESMQKHEDPNLLESEIESVLNNSDTFLILLDYSRRSFCPESVLFYKDVQLYKKMVVKFQDYTNNCAFQNQETIKKHRFNIQKLVLNIVHCYLNEGSINELNVPNGKALRNDIHVIISELECGQGMFPIGLFDPILVESLLTLLGLYERLKQSNKIIQEYSRNWTEKTIVSHTVCQL